MLALLVVVAVRVRRRLVPPAAAEAGSPAAPPAGGGDVVSAPSSGGCWDSVVAFRLPRRLGAGGAGSSEAAACRGLTTDCRPRGIPTLEAGRAVRSSPWQAKKLVVLLLQDARVVLEAPLLPAALVRRHRNRGTVLAVSYWDLQSADAPRHSWHNSSMLKNPSTRSPRMHRTAVQQHARALGCASCRRCPGCTQAPGSATAHLASPCVPLGAAASCHDPAKLIAARQSGPGRPQLGPFERKKCSGA